MANQINQHANNIEDMKIEVASYMKNFENGGEITIEVGKDLDMNETFYIVDIMIRKASGDRAFEVGYSDVKEFSEELAAQMHKAISEIEAPTFKLAAEVKHTIY